MGKLSSVFILLLMINIVGFILMGGMIEEGLASGNPYITENSLLVKLYSPANTDDGGTTYILNNESALYSNVPQQTPSSFLQEGLSFVDRIFILFGFVQTILGVLLFPIALISFLGIPSQLATLLFPPLVALYILGIIDLFSGGNS